MTDEDKNTAAAYIKLHDDVRKLILDIVQNELAYSPHSEFSAKLVWFVRNHVIDHELRTQMNNYRIVYKGTTASTY